MTAYLVIDISIFDTPKMEEYERHVLPLLKRFGGTPIAYDDNGIVLEGAWNNRVLIVAFPSKDDIRAFFNSPEYAPWKSFRRKHSDDRAVAIQAIDPG